MTDEKKQQLIEHISNALNDSGAYTHIIEIYEAETGLTVNSNSDVFHEIEEFIVDKLEEAANE